MDELDHTREVVVTFRVRPHEQHLFRAAASRRGLYVSQWLREAALAVLRRELTAEQEHWE